MGMDRHTGKLLDGLPHVRQSAIDVLQTVAGERVMRLSYGSRLLESAGDCANPRGRALLLGRIADPLATWEGDRLDLKRVDMTMNDQGHMLVSVEGSTDDGLFRMEQEDLAPDPRISAYVIEHESAYLGTTTVGDALDVVVSLFARYVSGADFTYSPSYVEPTDDPFNTAAIRYGSKSLYVFLVSLIQRTGTFVTTKVPSQPLPPNPVPQAPVFAPVPNAAGVLHPLDGASASQLMRTRLGGAVPLNQLLFQLEVFARGFSDVDEAFVGGS